jgi:thiosulfate dehydrogenase
MHGFRHSRFSLLVASGVLVLSCLITSGCSTGDIGTVKAELATGQHPVRDAQQEELIRQGKLIFDQTPKYASGYVGNKLACNDCHIQSGTAAHAAPMIDLAGLFPMFKERAGRMISLSDRIEECFSRSEAGRPVPENGREMQALLAYIDWLSRDEVKGESYEGRGFVKLPELTGDPVAGGSIYASYCAGCHGNDGAGVPPILPAVWGPDSYNDGAGMNNPGKMAAFVAHNMPQNQPGTLTPQQAYDVAAYIHSKPRPKFNQEYKNY